MPDLKSMKGLLQKLDLSKRSMREPGQDPRGSPRGSGKSLVSQSSKDAAGPVDAEGDKRFSVNSTWARSNMDIIKHVLQEHDWKEYHLSVAEVSEKPRDSKRASASRDGKGAEELDEKTEGPESSLSEIERFWQVLMKVHEAIVEKCTRCCSPCALFRCMVAQFPNLQTVYSFVAPAAVVDVIVACMCMCMGVENAASGDWRCTNRELDLEDMCVYSRLDVCMRGMIVWIEGMCLWTELCMCVCGLKACECVYGPEVYVLTD